MHIDDDDDGQTTSIAVPIQVIQGGPGKAGYLMVVSSRSAGVSGQMFKLNTAEMTIGRGADVEIRIDDEGISRKHARFTQTAPGCFRLSDLGSRNGTFVNGERIVSAELKDGDKVQVGSTAVLLFSLQDELEEQFTLRMFESATHDGLTQLLNKNYFKIELDKELSYSQRYRSPLSLMMIDVDHFKRVNDTYGHIIGDQVLVRLAARLAQLVRKEDVLARYGGEEFVSLLRQADQASAVKCAERCRAAAELLAVKAGSQMVVVTISLGIATLMPGQLSTPEAMIALADANLYRAKNAGRNRIVASAYTA